MKQPAGGFLAVKPYLRELSLRREMVNDVGDAFPFTLPVLRNLERLTFHPDVTFFVGENGTGKSTLLEAIARVMGFNAEGGSKNFNFTTHAEESNLHEYLRAVKGVKAPKDGFFLRAESFYNVASYVDAAEVAGSYGGRSLHAQSHGESFLALLQNRFRGQGLYLLDEPEAALSPSRQLSALAIIHRLVKADSQFIIATHSPIIMAYPNARIYLFDDDGIREIAYEETEHYKITRDFIDRREVMLRVLLEEEET